MACTRRYNERSGTSFNDLSVPTDIVFLVVLWRLRDTLSLRDLAEMFLDRRFAFSHETVRTWETTRHPLTPGGYPAPLLTGHLRARRRGKAGRKWHCNETYIKGSRPTDGDHPVPERYRGRDGHLVLPNVTQPSSWLITRTDRFAAVSLSPVNDWLSMHYTTHVTEFDRLFLQDKPSNAAGQYAARSPILFAHRALLEHGATSSLAIYPQEGHDVHQFPTVIDRGARIVAWFDRFMPTSTPPA